MANKAPYVYQHYPKVVKTDKNEEIVVKDAKDHWKFARNDFLQDEIAQEQFAPSLADENEGQNILKLKTKTIVQPPVSQPQAKDDTKLGA